MDCKFGDDEDDHLSLNEALLPVSDEFDSLSCSCDANSSILVASVGSVYNCKWWSPSAEHTFSTTRYNSLQPVPAQ